MISEDGWYSISKLYRGGIQLNIGFIGAGKVGCTLGKYFSQDAETVITGYYSRSTAEDAARFTGSKCYESMKELVEDCDIIFLTVPDGSIQDTWERIREYEIRGKTICHCSGAMSSQDAFSGIEEAGAFGYSVHPLFAVSDKYHAYRELAGVFFTLEGMESAGAREIQRILSGLGNPYRIIAGKDKITYHCAAAMASNLVCGLIDQSIALMERCGFTEEEAISALAPILTGNMSHIAEKGPAASLTGPIERNDIETVSKHLDCLVDDSEQMLYSLLSSRLIQIAQARHPKRDYSGMSELIGKGEIR